MAYGAVLTTTEHVIAGRRHLLVQVAETELAATSEYHIHLTQYFPNAFWKIVRFKLTETSGTAATYAPTWSATTAPVATHQDYGTIGAAAAPDSTNTGAGWVGSCGTLYVRSTPNAGADNITTSWILFCEGWDA